MDTRVANSGLALLGVIAFVPVGASQEIRYRRLVLPTWPSPTPRTIGTDINDAGVVCGYSWRNNIMNAVIWDRYNGMRALGNLVEGRDDLGERAEAINESTQVVGAGTFPEGGTSYTTMAFRWDAKSGMSALGDLPGGSFYSWAKGINNVGHVAGISVSTHYGEWMQEGFFWSPETGMIGLGNLLGFGHWTSIAHEVNDSGIVTGGASSSRGFEAYIWTEATGMIGLGDLGGGPFSNSEGFAINAPGQVAGIATSPTTGLARAFLWSAKDGMLDLGVLPGHEWSAAGDVNDREQVVGWSSLPYPPGGEEAFIWDRQHGMRSLNTLLDPCVPAWQRRLGQALAINNPGQIVAVDGGNGIFLDPYVPGDLDGDSAVSIQDLATLLAHFGRAGDVGYIQGDIHGCDRDVDLEDLAVLLENFGQTLE